MRIIITFIIAILLFTTAAVAQSKNTLADGNPPLTQTMVNRYTGLMEWSLNVEFTDADRTALRSQLISYWKNSDEKSIRSVVETLVFEQKWAAAGETQKRDLQPQIQKKLLETLEQNQSDELNKLLLNVYNRKQTADPVNISGNLNSENKSFPAELNGRWQVSHMNSMTTQNVYSGALGDANGMIAEFDIKPDGRIIYSFYLSQNNYGCTTKIKTSKTGRAVVTGSRIAFEYGAGTTTSTDSCNAKNNYTKNLGKTSDTFDFNVKRENGKTQFCFADAKLKDCAVKVN